MAATMSTLSSGLNSVSNVIVEDYVRPFKASLTDHRALILGKVLTVVLVVVSTLIALWLAKANSTSIWDMLLVIGGVFFAPMGSMFTLGVLTKRANATGVVIGMLVSIALTLYCNRYLALHPFFYAPIGLGASFIVGYLASLLFPGKERDLTGLTIYSLPEKTEN